MNGGSSNFTEFTIVTNIFPKQYEMSWVRTADRDGEKTKGTYRTSRDFNRYARAKPTDAWQELDSWQWPLEIGRSWRYEIPNQAGTQIWEVKIEGWEEISVPAGKFKTVRVAYDLVRHPDMLGSLDQSVVLTRRQGARQDSGPSMVRGDALLSE